jgi:hypothetical protein
MNETNRLLITLAAAAWIVLMAVLIFITWAAPDDAIDKLGDFVEFLDDNDSTGGKLIVSLAALAASIFALLIIIVELAPEDEPRELRVEQAGATTIIPADALRLRLEEALLSLPDVTAARARVWSREKGIAANLELTVAPTANIANVTQEAGRVVVDTVQTDLGLPVAGVPSVKIAFGGTRHPAPQASSSSAPPAPVVAPPVQPEPAAPGHADSSPGPLVYDEPPPGDGQPPQT